MILLISSSLFAQNPKKSIVYHKHNTSINAAISKNKYFGDVQTSRGIITFFFKNYGIQGLMPVPIRRIKGLIKLIKKNDYNQFPILVETMWNSIKKLKR